jgi:hypothetical protein
MSSFYMGLKVGDKARRNYPDPRVKADKHTGQSFKSMKDGTHYVSLGVAKENNQIK